MTGSKFIITTLLEKLLECRINDFDLNARERVLTFTYKEDFDRYLREFPNAEPVVKKDTRGNLPYGWDHYAFFEYDGWEIRGNIVSRKP